MIGQFADFVGGRVAAGAAGFVVESGVNFSKEPKTIVIAGNRLIAMGAPNSDLLGLRFWHFSVFSCVDCFWYFVPPKIGTIISITYINKIVK